MIGASARLALALGCNERPRARFCFLRPLSNTPENATFRIHRLVEPNGRALLEDCFELTALVREFGLGQCRWLPQMFRE